MTRKRDLASNAHPLLIDVRGIDRESGLLNVYAKWDYGEFIVEVEALASEDFGLVIRRLAIEGDSVTVGTLQDLKLGTLRDELVKWIRIGPQVLGEGITFTGQLDDSISAKRDEVHRISRELKARRPARGRGAKNPGWYRVIAEMYLAMLDAHGSRGVIQSMAKELDAKPNTVSQWVRKARLNGWITEAPEPGRAGGKAGQKLKEWRKENES